MTDGEVRAYRRGVVAGIEYAEAVKNEIGSWDLVLQGLANWAESGVISETDSGIPWPDAARSMAPREHKKAV